MASHGIGSYAFLIGFILAVVLGLVAGLAPAVLADSAGLIVLIFIILGLVVGFLNIREEHRGDFLVAVIAVAMIGVIPVQQLTQMAPQMGNVLGIIFNYIVAFSAPAALLVGLKQIWALGMKK
jgi:hypothetical protein